MSAEHRADRDKVSEDLDSEDQAPRDFLWKTGRFAAITTAAITFLLGTSLSSRAVAASDGSHAGYGSWLCENSALIIKRPENAEISRSVIELSREIRVQLS